jgi:hypothetical protein
VLDTGVEFNARDLDLGEDEFHRFVQIIDGGLDALTPSLGTARELVDLQGEFCKLGLEVCQLILKRLNFLSICHSVSPNEWRLSVAPQTLNLAAAAMAADKSRWTYRSYRR